MADFQAPLAELTELGASVYALSTDNEEKARGTVEKLGLTYPVIYGVDGAGTAKLLRAHYEERRNIVQPSGFVLTPEHDIASVTYSTGPIGRVVAEDAIRFIRFQQKRRAEAAAQAAGK